MQIQKLDLNELLRHAMDGAIVHTLKNRHLGDHGDLFRVVEKRLKKFYGSIDEEMFKKRIGILIELEYIERDKHNPMRYSYRM